MYIQYIVVLYCNIYIYCRYSILYLSTTLSADPQFQICQKRKTITRGKSRLGYSPYSIKKKKRTSKTNTSYLEV